MSYRRKARAAYKRLSPSARKRIAEAGVDVIRGGLRSTELSNLREFTEEGPRGKDVRHTRVDPEKAAIAEELVKSGLAYLPSQADRDRPSYVVLTRWGRRRLSSRRSRPTGLPSRPKPGSTLPLTRRSHG